MTMSVLERGSIGLAQKYGLLSPIEGLQTHKLASHTTRQTLEDHTYGLQLNPRPPQAAQALMVSCHAA